MLLVALVLTPAARSELTAEQRQVILDEAQSAYRDGIDALRADPVGAARSFATAAARYRQLVDDGVINGRLLYNLGNALLQRGDVGEAILAYRSAETLIPGDPRLEHNLEYARSLRRDRIGATGGRELVDALLAWHERTTAATRFIVFAVTWIGLWGVMTVNLLVPHVAWRWLAGGLAVLSLACGVSLAFDLLAPPREGVIVADEVTVRKGNGEGFDPLFAEPLHQGVEFRLVEQRPDWLHIELANGARGWIREGQAGMVGGG